MNEWRENANGNYVYALGREDVMTVFKRDDGDWAGVYQDRVTWGVFDTAEEAMAVMDPITDGDLSMLKPSEYHGWTATKDGKGYFKRQSGLLATAKRTTRGSWFVTVNGDLWEGQWFKTADEAKRAVDDCSQALSISGRDRSATDYES